MCSLGGVWTNADIIGVADIAAIKLVIGRIKGIQSQINRGESGVKEGIGQE